MDVLGFLGTTAEVAITFTGFISVFFVLSRSDGSFLASRAILIKLMLASSVACVFLAALPFALTGFGLYDVVLWRACGIVFLIVSLTATLYVFRNRHLLSGSTSIFYNIPAHLLNLGTIAFALANTIGWPNPPSGALHLTGIWFLFGISVMNFLRLVLDHVLGENDVNA